MIDGPENVDYDKVDAPPQFNFDFHEAPTVVMEDNIDHELQPELLEQALDQLVARQHGIDFGTADTAPELKRAIRDLGALIKDGPNRDLLPASEAEALIDAAVEEQNLPAYRELPHTVQLAVHDLHEAGLLRKALRNQAKQHVTEAPRRVADRFRSRFA